MLSDPTPEPDVNRREVLATAAVGTATLLAGCSDDGDGDGGTGTPRGEWERRRRVVNEDDQPREWRVESRTGDGSAAAAWATVPAGEEWEFALLGQLRDERLEVYAESDDGATAAPWRPSECPRMAATVTIPAANPGWN